MDNPIDIKKLRELASFEAKGGDDSALSRLMTLVADFLSARRVSLMLIDTVGEKGRRLKLAALHGNLPDAAWSEQPTVGQGIAGKVLAEEQSLLIANINVTSLKTTMRHSGEPASFIACPVSIAGQSAGVLNISDSIAGTPFTDEDLAWSELAAVLVGRSIHQLRLQGMLDSSFAQMAMTLEGVTDAGAFMSLSTQEPRKVAKILAKAFYKEMDRCGFTFNQILHAAGDIISELTLNLNRHKQRRKRTDK
jgi:L-methionine (R)-S-oxide reductase